MFVVNIHNNAKVATFQTYFSSASVCKAGKFDCTTCCTVLPVSQTVSMEEVFVYDTDNVQLSIFEHLDMTVE